MSDVFDPSLKGLNLESEDLFELFQRMRRAPIVASGAWHRSRGYGLELLLQEALRRESLDPRPPYKPEGEQIDGSFVLDGRVYLLEAKWTADPLPASTVYAFKGKVAGKLIGTIGFLVSVSGFGEDTVDAVCLGKSLDVLLVDGADLESSLSGQTTLAGLLRRKVRSAAEDGVVYLPSHAMRQASSVPAGQGSSTASDEFMDWSTTAPTTPPSLIVIAGSLVAARGVRSVLELLSFSLDTRFMTAGGSVASLRLAAAANRIAAHHESPLLVALDTDSINKQDLALLPPGTFTVNAGSLLAWAKRLQEVDAGRRNDLILWLATQDPDFADFTAWLERIKQPASS